MFFVFKTNYNLGLNKALFMVRYSAEIYYSHL